MKKYESKKIYGKKYNKLHSTVQIDKSLYEELKEYIKDKNMTIKDFISFLIKKEMK